MKTVERSHQNRSEMPESSFGVASERIVTFANCARTGNNARFWDTDLFVYLWKDRSAPARWKR